MTEWRADEVLAGMRQRVFTVNAGDHSVPGVLWTPADAGGATLPLVLIGHGGGGHKLDESRLDLATRYTGRGLAAAAIDGPWHGERQFADGGARAAYDERAVDAMVGDWSATLDALVALPEIDGERVGYGGVSMGTMFGLPFVAADPRVRAAVLGLCGLREATGSPLTIAARLAQDARTLTVPVLFLLQWDDDVFERAGSLELFDLIAAPDKRLLGNVGLHHETPEHARAAGTAFLVEHLGAPDG